MNTNDELRQSALDFHSEHRGKWAMHAKTPLASLDDLRLAYSPGVAEPCKEIAWDAELAYLYTSKSNTVAVISNGTAVLGLGTIGPLAALPVMEGKAILFKHFADIDAIPLVIDEKDPEKLVAIIKSLLPSFGGINLEDIKAPECFIIERALRGSGIPVVHDDQHGTAMVILAGIINALKVVGKGDSPIKIVVVGAGAAGHATVELILAAHNTGVLTLLDIIVCDSKGIVSSERADLDTEKQKLVSVTNFNTTHGTLDDAITGADILIGLSQHGSFNESHIQKMNSDAIVFALANPVPEIMPDIARASGARVVATGRSDFPNQVNNALAFPGLFRGLLDSRTTEVTTDHMLAVARAIGSLVPEPTTEMIIPSIFHPDVAQTVAGVFKK